MTVVKRPNIQRLREQQGNSIFHLPTNQVGRTAAAAYAVFASIFNFARKQMVKAMAKRRHRRAAMWKVFSLREVISVPASVALTHTHTLIYKYIYLDEKRVIFR